MKAEHQRGVLLAVSTFATLAGVAISFGPGPALIVAGLVGMAVAVAWAYVAVSA